MQVRMHPSSEDLAAFIDGTLQGRARETVTEHLADCPECYRVFAETLRFQVEHAEGRPKQHGLGRTLALAASLVLALALGLWLARLVGPESASAPLGARLMAPAQATVQDLWVEPAIPGFADQQDRRQAAFRAGVVLVDLQVAIRAGNAATASRLVRHLADLAGKPGASALQGALADPLAKDLDETLATALTEKPHGTLDPDALRFGRWAEVGRLAARSQDAAALQDPRFRAVLNGAMAGSPQLEAVQLRLASPPADRRAFDQLADAFTELIFLEGYLHEPEG